jgi:hypothetical protein
MSLFRLNNDREFAQQLCTLPFKVVYVRFFCYLFICLSFLYLPFQIPFLVPFFNVYVRISSSLFLYNAYSFSPSGNYMYHLL